MQTFLISPKPHETAEILDNKRLFKQIVEANQILDCLLNKETRRKNHPAVKMWKNYEWFLNAEYVTSMIEAWTKKKNPKTGKFYQCDKSIKTWWIHGSIITSGKFSRRTPHWFSDEFFISHKSNLIRKKPEWYRPIFGLDIPNDLPYIWPV